MPENEQPIITFGVTQRNLVMGFMVVVGALSAGNFAINWKTQWDLAEIKATLPLKEKEFEVYKEAVTRNQEQDNRDHKELFGRVGDLEMFTGIKRKNSAQ